MPTIRPRTVLLILLLVAVVFFTWATYQFSQASRQSERHTYYYTIDLSYDTTIDNVTFLLPVPEVNSTPVFMESVLNGSAYGISPDWDLSIVHENGSPMLAIRAARMVPEYHGSPIPIEPGASMLPTTLVPGHEYSPDTPVLMPITIAVMEQASSPVNTRDPVGHEPLLSSGGPFTLGSCVAPVCNGIVYDHTVPVFISYTSERPVTISLRVSVQGSNSIWQGGWRSNTYSDSVSIEIVNGTTGWIQRTGKLLAAQGSYY